MIMTSTEHGEFCIQPYRGDCANFSTDGTRLGAIIAHTFGTTSEEEIANMPAFGGGADGERLTGMLAEQAEWESEDCETW